MLRLQYKRPWRIALFPGNSSWSWSIYNYPNSNEICALSSLRIWFGWCQTCYSTIGHRCSITYHGRFSIPWSISLSANGWINWIYDFDLTWNRSWKSNQEKSRDSHCCHANESYLKGMLNLGRHFVMWSPLSTLHVICSLWVITYWGAKKQTIDSRSRTEAATFMSGNLLLLS